MTQTQFLFTLFTDTYNAIKEQTMDITHNDSVQRPPFSGNSTYWITGHIVVARCNFLMLLEVQSIWSMEQCRLFIPGSAPVTGDEAAVSFDSLLADLARTQDQLLSALAQASSKDLTVTKDDQTVGEQLITYHAHESYHLGQLEILCQLIKSRI